MAHLKDALAVPARDRLRTPVGRIARKAPSSPRPCPSSRCSPGCAASSPSPSSWTSTAARPAWSPWRDIVEELVGEVRDEHDAKDTPELAPAPPEDGRPAWDVDGSCRVDILQRIGLDVPEGPYETVAGLVADLLGRIPAPRRQGRTARLAALRPAGRPLPRRTGPPGQDGPGGGCDGGRPVSLLQLVFAALLVLANGFLRRRRVRARLRPPQPDRTARHRPGPPGAVRPRTPAADDGRRPVRHHRLLPDARRGRRADGGAPAGTGVRVDPPAARHDPPPRLRHRPGRGGLLPPRHRRDGPEEPRHGGAREGGPVAQPRPGLVRPPVPAHHGRPRRLRPGHPAAVPGRAEGRGGGGRHHRAAQPPPGGLRSGGPPRPRGAGAPGGRPGTGLPPGDGRPAAAGVPGHGGALGHPGRDRGADRPHRLLPLPGRGHREGPLHGVRAREGRPRPGGLRPAVPQHVWRPMATPAPSCPSTTPSP